MRVIVKFRGEELSVSGQWEYVPRRGDLLRFEGGCYRVHEVEWNCPGYECDQAVALSVVQVTTPTRLETEERPF